MFFLRVIVASCKFPLLYLVFGVFCVTLIGCTSEHKKPEDGKELKKDC